MVHDEPIKPLDLPTDEGYAFPFPACKQCGEPLSLEHNHSKKKLLTFQKDEMTEAIDAMYGNLPSELKVKGAKFTFLSTINEINIDQKPYVCNQCGRTVLLDGKYSNEKADIENAKRVDGICKFAMMKIRIE